MSTLQNMEDIGDRELTATRGFRRSRCFIVRTNRRRLLCCMPNPPGNNCNVNRFVRCLRNRGIGMPVAEGNLSLKNQTDLQMMPWKLLLADGHDIVIAGVRSLLDNTRYEIVGAVKDRRTLVQVWKRLKPDLVITAVTMPLLNGIEAARQIRMLDPNVRFVFLTMHADIRHAIEALSIGHCGYVLKTSAIDELAIAICAVLEGGCYVARDIADPVGRVLEATHSNRAVGDPLTSRQREVLQLLAEGRGVKAIGFILSLSPRTIEFHKYRIMDALGVRSTAELARSAMAMGMLN